MSLFRRNHSEKNQKNRQVYFFPGWIATHFWWCWLTMWLRFHWATPGLSNHLPTFSSLGFYTTDSEGRLEETLRWDEVRANLAISHITVLYANLTSIPEAFYFSSVGHNKSTYHTEDAVHTGVGLEFLGLRGKRRIKIQLGNRRISR